MKNTQIYAHRGSKGTHPENTMIAFKEALRVGADGIEFDVHLSSDGELVIIHDETLDRTTSLSGYVRDFSAEELKSADAGGKFSEAFHGEKMNIELKTDKLPYDGIEKKVVDVIRQHHMESRVILSSFNHQSIENVKTLAPELERALLFEGLPVNIEELLAEKKEAGFHPDKNSLTPSIHASARKLGYKVRPWVANRQEDIERLATLGVDVIMTDFPEKAIMTLKNMTGK